MLRSCSSFCILFGEENLQSISPEAAPFAEALVDPCRCCEPFLPYKQIRLADITDDVPGDSDCEQAMHQLLGGGRASIQSKDRLAFHVKVLSHRIAQERTFTTRNFGMRQICRPGAVKYPIILVCA